MVCRVTHVERQPRNRGRISRIRCPHAKAGILSLGNGDSHAYEAGRHGVAEATPLFFALDVFGCAKHWAIRVVAIARTSVCEHVLKITGCMKYSDDINEVVTRPEENQMSRKPLDLPEANLCKPQVI